MKIISHRGNIYGRNHNMENNPIYIEDAINLGYDVECDLRYNNNMFYLGHDEPQYPIELSWLLSYKNNLWIHCKDIESIEMLSNSDLNYFWHDVDLLTITSKNIKWCLPNIFIKDAITVTYDYIKTPDYILGVCTDNPLKFKNEK